MTRVVTSPAQLDLSGVVLAIGNFDGMHRGHRTLLARMQELADELGLPGVVISFFPTSRMVFANSGYLNSAEEKVALLSRYGPEAVVLIPFSREYARTDKSEFLGQLEALSPAAIIVGEDFRFGADRAGTLNDLSLVTGKLEVFGLVNDDGRPISSSRLRELIEAGAVEDARALLGDAYLAAGEVVRGEQRGRTIGWPTLNVMVGQGKVLPAGVFAVTVTLPDGSTAGGMANVGSRPSFEGTPPSLEVHVFDFEGDLYGEEVTVRFIRRLRSQVRFASLDELKQQLALDAAEARKALSETGGEQ